MSKIKLAAGDVDEGHKIRSCQPVFQFLIHSSEWVRAKSKCFYRVHSTQLYFIMFILTRF